MLFLLAITLLVDNFVSVKVPMSNAHTLLCK
uniref:Uncharacterized protein n=1 Tax=Anguilla anguilla TaxID=7936 RepID=A0A0E9RSH0_ANGAN